MLGLTLGEPGVDAEVLEPFGEGVVDERGELAGPHQRFDGLQVFARYGHGLSNSIDPALCHKMIILCI